MKRGFIAIISILAVVFAIYMDFSKKSETSVKRDSESIYQDAYDSGYNIGYDRGREVGYEAGYDDGASYGWFDDIANPASYLEDEAVDYVRKYCEWHPEEAMTIIEAYQSGIPAFEGDPVPSYQEYLEAIESLKYFYIYFYNREYE